MTSLLWVYITRRFLFVYITWQHFCIMAADKIYIANFFHLCAVDPSTSWSHERRVQNFYVYIQLILCHIVFIYEYHICNLFDDIFLHKYTFFSIEVNTITLLILPCSVKFYRAVVMLSISFLVTDYYFYEYMSSTLLSRLYSMKLFCFEDMKIKVLLY